MKDISLAPRSFTGRRSNNQDACKAIKLNDEIYFLAVADGMGGSVGGQIASKLVIENAIKIISEETSHELPDSEMKSVLERVFVSSQKVITDKINEDPSLNGMGTTLTCVLIKDGKYVWGNIGDSRTYLLRNELLKQITEDHTYVQDYIKESGKSLPLSVLKQYGNYLQKAIDGNNDQADIFPLDKDYESLTEGDIFLLCSDGLITDKVQEDTTLFRDYILGCKNLNDASEQLIALAFHSGSKDNISAVLFSFGAYKRKKVKIERFNYPPKEKAVKSPKQKMKLPSLSTVIGSTAFILTIFLAYILLFKPDQNEIMDKLNPFNQNDSKIDTSKIVNEKGIIKENKGEELKEFPNINEIIDKPPIVKDKEIKKETKPDKSIPKEIKKEPADPNDIIKPKSTSKETKEAIVADKKNQDSSKEKIQVQEAIIQKEEPKKVDDKNIVKESTPEITDPNIVEKLKILDQYLDNKQLKEAKELLEKLNYKCNKEYYQNGTSQQRKKELELVIRELKSREKKYRSLI